LDQAAYGLCELYCELNLASFTPPEMIFLCSPGGCNSTDAQFAAGGAISPAKFAHTLPGIRGSVLLQVMNWHGPLLCFQNDPHTVGTSLVQSTAFDRRAWIFGQQGALSFCLRSAEDGPIGLTPAACAPVVEDSALLHWLAHPEGAISLPEGWQAERV
jgi:hypothetical protein